LNQKYFWFFVILGAFILKNNPIDFYSLIFLTVYEGASCIPNLACAVQKHGAVNVYAENRMDIAKP
jgi:hypothetical protein